jgi:pyruvate formate lyase activating enzyme
MDPVRHRAATGVSNEIILDNLRALAGVHPAISIRIPVIPGVNDDDDNIAAAAEFVHSVPGVRQIDLLPYHQTGEAKFARLGLDYTLRGTMPPDKGRLDALAARFRVRGLVTTIGGHA